MEKAYENTMNFLLYSYFGIEDFGIIKSDAEKAKVACARRAYLDLARTVKFTKTTSDIEKLPKNEAKKYNESKNALKIDVYTYIVKEIDECTEGNFEQKHKGMCESIVKKMNGSNLLKDAFTCGQAQKWLNMTLKYYWLLGILPEKIKAEDLHVPIDSYIIEAVESSEDIIKHGLNMESGLKSDSWSSIKKYDEEYRKLQSGIKTKIKETSDFIPIEWENIAWLEVAKYRANK